MDEVRMDDVVETEAPERFLILLDKDESQPEERLSEDGQMDLPFLVLFGRPDSLYANFVPGQRTQDDAEKMGEMRWSRQVLKGHWPALTHYVHTGEWCNSNQVPGDKIHLQLDPFQRELVLQALQQLKDRERGLRGRRHLYTDRKLYGDRQAHTEQDLDQDAGDARIREIQALELAIELASAPAEEPGDEPS